MLSLGECLKVKEEAKLPKLTTCKRCNYVSSQEICKACILLEGLNRGLPKLGIGKSSKVSRMRAVAHKQINTSYLCRCIQKDTIVRTEDDVIDKKCLCGGFVNKNECNGVDLTSTRKLLKELDL